MKRCFILATSTFFVRGEGERRLGLTCYVAKIDTGCAVRMYERGGPWGTKEGKATNRRKVRYIIGSVSDEFRIS
jgi:hypothetical protein